MNYRARQYYIVTALLLLGVAIYQLLHITGPVMFPDEFGYWANAAELLGYDWSEVASLQSYYSFGYSFVLLPLLRWITDPVILYRAAVVLNVVFVYLHAVLLWNIADRLRPQEKNGNVFFCMVAAFYPNLVFNMQLTWAECLLTLLFMGSIWLLLQYEGKKQARYALLFTGSLLGLYFVHMRSLGVLAAGLLTLLWTWVRGRKMPWKTIALWSVAVVTCLAAGNFLKEFLQSGLYVKAEQGLLNANDYAGQLDKLHHLISLSGMTDFAVSCVGKLFYLGIATCGTIYFGVWHVLKRVKKSPVYVYALLAVLLTFGISALYTMGGGRGDAYLYGRYNEFVIPVFVYFGLLEMSENKYTGRAAAGILILQAGMAYALLPVMAQADPSRFQGYFTVGISYVLKEYMPRMQDYVILPWVAGSLALALLWLVLGVFTRKKRAFAAYLMLFAGLYLYTAVSAGEKYLYDHSMDSGADMALAVQAKERMQEGDTFLFLHSYSDVQYVDSLQFALRDYPLCVVEEKDFAITGQDWPAFLFTYSNSAHEALLRQQYDTVMSTWHFKLYCNKR